MTAPAGVSGSGERAVDPLEGQQDVERPVERHTPVLEEFGIEIPDEDAEKITRVKEAVEYIEQHAKKK